MDWTGGMEWWNHKFSKYYRSKPKGHNIVKCLVDNLGFKLMLITSSMVMSALSGQLATVTVGSTHIFVL